MGNRNSRDVMIDAALRILAAWVASQTISTADGRYADSEELQDLQPLYIEYHRTAGWLPGRHRRDN